LASGKWQRSAKPAGTFAALRKLPVLARGLRERGERGNAGPGFNQHTERGKQSLHERTTKPRVWGRL